MSNKQIASALGISLKTAMHHTGNIYDKLAVHGRAGATAWGVPQQPREHLTSLGALALDGHDRAMLAGW